MEIDYFRNHVVAWCRAMGDTIQWLESRATRQRVVLRVEGLGVMVVSGSVGCGGFGEEGGSSFLDC